MTPIEIFFSYAHEDEELMDDVRRQLVVFERQGKIVKWHDRKIPPGAEGDWEIDQRLRNAHVILLFVSSHFLESRYCWDIEVKTALERHEKREARVIPIILRPCAWDSAPFAKLQALPRDARPLSQWPDRDQVCLDVARSIMSVAEEIAAHNPIPAPLRVSRRVERRMFEGDRIARIIVPFAPPKGINIPDGYQRRLNYIAAEVARDGAVRKPGGGYKYPAQFKGSAKQIKLFAGRLPSLGEISELGLEDNGEESQIWFEYSGAFAPPALKDEASALELEAVHCGAWLIG